MGDFCPIASHVFSWSDSAGSFHGDAMSLPNLPMFEGLPSFLETMFALLERMRVDVSGFLMDHVCYRVATLERYATLKTELSILCDEPYESLVNGRPISVFVLRTPFRIGERIISCIELPAPKPGADYPEGWEHAEFVVDEPLPHFESRYDELPFDHKGMDKQHNRELGLKIGQGLQVKFHEQPLTQVIKIEQQGGM